ncbi:MAG: PAS domain S-box protein [Planctomycetota bacterium]|nr:PAS domain S-box protein [Planctomycetota bacterium]
MKSRQELLDEIETLRRELTILKNQSALSSDATNSLKNPVPDINSVIEHSPVGLALVNSTAQLLSWNPRFQKMLGYSNEEMSKLRVPDFTHPEDVAVGEKAIGELFRKEKHSIRFRKRCLNKAGQVFWVEPHIVGIRDENGEVQCLLSTIVDVSDQIETAETLKKRDRQLRQAQKMEAVGRLANGVAHDFNNLLTGIQVSTHYLLRQVPKNSEMRDDVLEIDNCCKRGSKLTRRLLAFSRGNKEQRVIIDVNYVVKSMENMLRRLIGERISLEINLSSEVCSIHSDQNQLEQILLNLAINARDALESGGTLQIETDIVSGKVIQERLSVETDDDFVSLRVRDTGTGMADAVKERLFEPFYTTKAPGKGTGLGLAVVYNIVHEHDGLIDVQSEIGQGTSFNLYFPLNVSGIPDPRPKEESKYIFHSVGRERILLVEDDHQVRRMLVRILEDTGYTVYEAEDGEKALAVVESLGGDFDLLISDLILPKLNGDELFERIQRKYPNKKVLFMSGYGIDLTDRLLGKHSLESFIRKPLSPKQLIKKIVSIFKNTGHKNESEN